MWGFKPRDSKPFVLSFLLSVTHLASLEVLGFRGISVIAQSMVLYINKYKLQKQKQKQYI